MEKDEKDNKLTNVNNNRQSKRKKVKTKRVLRCKRPTVLRTHSMQVGHCAGSTVTGPDSTIDQRSAARSLRAAASFSLLRRPDPRCVTC